MVRRRRMRLMNGILPHLSLTRRFRINLIVIVSLLGLLVFIIIISALYSALQKQHLHHPHHGNASGRDLPSITIYSAPQPFSDRMEDIVDRRQVLAIRSWLSLSPSIDVVLFGEHPSIHNLVATLGPRVTVESAIDFTFLGTPFFHCMVARAQTSHSAISVLIDPETVLFPNIIAALQYAHQLNHDWFLIAMSSIVSHFPFHLDGIGNHWMREDGSKIDVKKLQDMLVQKQNCSNYGQRLIMAWNAGDLPLHSGVLPPFLYGRGFHNEWLVNEVLSSGFRFVFDATQVISSFFPETLDELSNKFFMDFGSKSVKNFEYGGNYHLSTVYGSLYYQPSNISSNLFKLVKCLKQYFFIEPSKNTLYSSRGPDEDASYNLKPGKKITCMKDIVQRRVLENQCSIMKLYRVASKTPMLLKFPFSLESLLQMVADKDKTVVLAIAGENYKEFLMSWICRLRALRITNFLVCALDPETYQFSVVQGLPVFRDPMAPTNISFNNCHFGTECFQRVTKVKSRIVLQILKLGYSVVLSDVDVYWFKNPLPILQSFGPAVLMAQSDEYNETGPINLPRRLNSGFYFARSDPSTIAAMAKVVKHASTSVLSEQPSFYDVLCGEGGVHRVGENRCLEPDTNLTVHFLDRRLFPNGAYKGLWEKRDVGSACAKQGCVVLHNNWVSGRKRKLERQVKSGLWDYDASSRMCLQRWHNRTSMS